MATIVASTPLGGAEVVAYNLPHTRMAAFDAAAGVVSTWAREGEGRAWAAAAAWPAGGHSVTALAWAPPESGAALVAGTARGAVLVWAAGPGGAWALLPELREGAHEVTALAFAPRELGALVAAAYADGAVRLFEAAAPLGATRWDLHSALRLAPEARGATSLAWRGHDAALPPMLAVGSVGGGALVWALRRGTMRWELVGALGDARADYGGAPVAAVAWAPAAGRPRELLAAAAGGRVVLWALRGAADAPEAERVAVLEHGAPVWQLAWNWLGSWLAASTEAGEVCLWRPDLAGEWRLLNRVGAAPTEGSMDAV
jgi:WD40 repeat protein